MGFFIKLLILAATYPLWSKVLKALYEDFQGALWEEGGLFGSTPTGRDLEELREKYEDYESPLVNVTHEEFEAARRGQPLSDGNLPTSTHTGVQRRGF